MVTSQNRGYVQDVLVENCSYIFDTSAIHGGRIPILQDAYMDVGGRVMQEQLPSKKPVMSNS